MVVARVSIACYLGHVAHVTDRVLEIRWKFYDGPCVSFLHQLSWKTLAWSDRFDQECTESEFKLVLRYRRMMLTKKKPASPAWSDVKSVVADLDKKQLVELVRDLYRLSKQNQTFLAARFALGEDPLAPYKKTIRDCMYPDVMKDKPVQIAKAKRAISDYSKAVGDPVGEAELMTLFVECGNSFTVEYGDIDEDFYNALNLMYRRTIEKVLSLTEAQHGSFKERLREIMESSSGIGWGYHDELCHDFYEAFPEHE